MKRDMELVRKILLFVESIDNIGRYVPVVIDGYTDDAIQHHIRMLLDRGYLKEKGGVSFTYDGVSMTGGAMTFEGSDFLDAARDDTIWRKAMDKIAATTGTVTVEVLKAILVQLSKSAVGL